MNTISVKFIDNSGIKGRENSYVALTVKADLVIQSWKNSLFSFEWLTPDGKIRGASLLSESDQQKFNAVAKKLKYGEAVERPILGFGILDNVEIGSKKDVFLTLASHGVTEISVHILKQDEKHFADYRV